MLIMRSEDMNTFSYRGVVQMEGKPKWIVLPPPIWWQVQPTNAAEFPPADAFIHGSVWPMLVDGFSREEGIS